VPLLAAHARALASVATTKPAALAPLAPPPARQTVPESERQAHDKVDGLRPWPNNAPAVLVNGVPIDPNTYADDDQFVALYNQMVHAYAAVALEKSKLAADPTNAAAMTREKQYLSDAQRALEKLNVRVAALESDPGRWIIHHDPIAAFVADIANGKDIAQAFRDAGDAVAANIKDVGPYVQTVCSFIPGFGTAVAACIGAAVALAKGEDIGDGLIDTIGGALPGGVATQMAFRAGVTAIKDACQGKTWEQIAWDSAREAMPPGPCRLAFDAATALAGAAIAQADPDAYQAIFTGAQKNGATNTDAPAVRLPTQQQVLTQAQLAQRAYERKKLPPTPTWKVPASTPMPPTQKPASVAPVLALAGVALAASRFIR